MKHFTEVRDAVLQALGAPPWRNLVEKFCVIRDLQGRVRLLVKPKASTDTEALRKDLGQHLTQAAEGYWSSEIWLWSPDKSKAEIALYEKAWSEAAPLTQGPPETRILERHISKSAWFGSRIREPWPLNAHTPPIVSFFSFKGGVGRTTALLSMAIQLSRIGKKVALVDLDLEAPGLASALSVDSQTFRYGVLDYLIEWPVLGGRALDLEDYLVSIDDSRVTASGQPITLIPAGCLDEHYLEKLARLDAEALYRLSLATDTSRSPLFGLLEELRRRMSPDCILMDSRSGLHDLGGLALSPISHLNVIFGLNSPQSWRGTELVVRFLGRVRLEGNLSQQPCALVLAMAPAPGADRDQTTDDFLTQSYEVFSNSFYDEEGSDGEWPLPQLQDQDQPHFPIVVGFDPMVQRYQSVSDIADRLTEGDFRIFVEKVLARLGRTLT